MNKIELQIAALTHARDKKNCYTVVLSEIEGNRRIPIVIAGYEAQTIAVGFEYVRSSRPFTHDLMKTLLKSFHIELMEVIISDLQDGVFFAKMVCISEHDTIEIDCRPSDALAMALRFPCPIYIYEDIFKQVEELIGEMPLRFEMEEGFDVETAKEAKKTNANNLAGLSIEDLDKMLTEVLAKEDYIQAIAIRDEINKRKS